MGQVATLVSLMKSYVYFRWMDRDKGANLLLRSKKSSAIPLPNYPLKTVIIDNPRHAIPVFFPQETISYAMIVAPELALLPNWKY